MPDLRTLADRANRELYAEVARRSGGVVTAEDGLVLVTGSHPSPVIANVAFRDLDSPAQVDGLLDRIAVHYGTIGHGASLLVAAGVEADLEGAATAAGWTPVIELPVMVVTTPIAVRPVDGASMRWIDPDAEVGAFREVLAEGFAEDDDERGMVRAVFASPESLEPPDVRAILAFADGRTVGAGARYRLGDGACAVVGWITVVDSHRRRGLGTAITAMLTNDALEVGGTMVALQASPMGAPVYVAMGFREVGLDRIWFPPEAAPAR